MTREEIADPLVPCSDAHCILAPQPRGPGMYTQGGCMHIKERGPGMTKLLMALGGEIARLRALPVLATCGPCRHLVSNPARVGLWCDGEKRALVSDAERRPVAPPSWCPLRGAVGR